MRKAVQFRLHRFFDRQEISGRKEQARLDCGRGGPCMRH